MNYALHHHRVPRFLARLVFSQDCELLEQRTYGGEHIAIFLIFGKPYIDVEHVVHRLPDNRARLDFGKVNAIKRYYAENLR